MFEELARQYYVEEEISDVLQSEIKKRFLRAEEFMPSEAKHIIVATHSFHDWFLTECSVYSCFPNKYCFGMCGNENIPSHPFLRPDAAWTQAVQPTTTKKQPSGGYKNGNLCTWKSWNESSRKL